NRRQRPGDGEAGVSGKDVAPVTHAVDSFTRVAGRHEKTHGISLTDPVNFRILIFDFRLMRRPSGFASIKNPKSKIENPLISQDHLRLVVAAVVDELDRPVGLLHSIEDDADDFLAALVGLDADVEKGF